MLLPWHHYQWYGDPQILRENFDAMRRFTDYIQTQSKDGLAPGGLGDWYDYGHGQPPGPSRFTPTELSATATWGLCALTVSRTAEVLDLAEESKKYRDLHVRIAADFQRHFRNPATGKLRHLGSPQCANAMALCAELRPNSTALHWWRISLPISGVAVGSRHPATWATSTSSARWPRPAAPTCCTRYTRATGWEVTADPEKEPDRAAPDVDAMMDGSQSLDHCMLGHVIEWYYGYVAGIRQAPGSVGLEKSSSGRTPVPSRTQRPRSRLRWAGFRAAGAKRGLAAA